MSEDTKKLFNLLKRVASNIQKNVDEHPFGLPQQRQTYRVQEREQKPVETQQPVHREQVKQREERSFVIPLLQGFQAPLRDLWKKGTRAEALVEDCLVSYIKGKYPRLEIETQYRLEGGGKIDVVVEKKQGIEIKVISSPLQIRDIRGQIVDYVKVFGKNNVFLLVFIKEDVYRKQEQKFVEYLRDYAEIMGTTPIMRRC